MIQTISDMVMLVFAIIGMVLLSLHIISWWILRFKPQLVVTTQNSDATYQNKRRLEDVPKKNGKAKSYGCICGRKFKSPNGLGGHLQHKTNRRYHKSTNDVKKR